MISMFDWKFLPEDFVQYKMPGILEMDPSLFKKEIYKVLEPLVHISAGITKRMYRVTQVGTEWTDIFLEDDLAKTDPPLPQPEEDSSEEEDPTNADPPLILPVFEEETCREVDLAELPEWEKVHLAELFPSQTLPETSGAYLPKDIAEDVTKKMPCFLCHISFKKKQHLLYHMASLHQPNQFECNNCHQEFSLVANLKRHVKQVHEKVKAFECPTCHAVFGRLQQFKKHMASSHKQMQTSECSICQKQIRSGKEMRIHMKIAHPVSKILECPICKHRFRLAWNLKSHIQLVHQGSKFQCSLCPKAYSTQSNLKRHEKSGHKP